MILTKNFGSAVILATVVVISIATSIIFWFAIYYWLQGKSFNFLNEIHLTLGVCLGGSVLFFIIAVLPSAFLIYNLDENFFGLSVVLRWVLFGLMWPILVLSIHTILPDFDRNQGFGLFFLVRGLNAVVGLLCAYLLFRIAFWGLQPAKDN